MTPTDGYPIMTSSDGDLTQSLLADLVKVPQSQRSVEQVDVPYCKPEINEFNKSVIHVELIKHGVRWTDVPTLATIGRFCSAKFDEKSLVSVGCTCERWQYNHFYPCGDGNDSIERFCAS